ncbi:BsuPI-related putative proteinase inhibitor [Halobacillus salinus]|nr:BsuPI-related putative proteinase inhibitor [Halobacillus salinus]
MKKLFAMMMGVIVLTLAACGTSGEMDEANGEGTEADQEQTEDQNTEKDMDALINQMATDVKVKATDDAANFDFSLTNTGEEPVTLGFASSQQYEVKVTNADAENVYTFSADKSFTQELTSEELANGKAISASEAWTDVEPGEYEVTVTFLVDTINDESVEATPFEMTQPFTIEAAQEGTNEQASVKEFEGDGEAFRNITVEGENGSYVVKGEARVFEGAFMYSVEDGHNVVVEPEAVQVDGEGAPSWSSFEIEVSISEDKLPEFGTVTMSIYEESQEDGEPTHENYIPLESF